MNVAAMGAGGWCVVGFVDARGKGHGRPNWWLLAGGLPKVSCLVVSAFGQGRVQSQTETVMVLPPVQLARK